MMHQIPMWTPFEPAKLFKQYTDVVPIELLENDVTTAVINAELNNYVCHFTFLWQLVDDVSRGKNMPIQGLFMDSESLTIRTNSRKDFQVGDIVQLKLHDKPTRYQIKDLRQMYGYFPKKNKTYLYMNLELLP